jgi:hypothetical protein
MDELIEQLTTKLGIDAETARDASSKAMALLKDNVGDDLFAKISAAIPGSSESAAVGAEASTAGDGGKGGLLGSIADMASGVLGGSVKDAADLASSLGDSGLSTDQIGSFVTTILEFLRDKLGDETVDQLLAKVPMLKSLVG